MISFRISTQIPGELISRPVSQAEKLLISQVKKDTEPYVPARDLVLSRIARIEDNLIVYPGPYARFLYYGKVMIYPPTGSTFAPFGEHKIVTDRNLIFSKAVHQKATSHWFDVAKAANLDKWIDVAKKAVSHYAK